MPIGVSTWSSGPSGVKRTVIPVGGGRAGVGFRLYVAIVNATDRELILSG
ncbi:hypothetical protein K376_03843 [Streptomyces sp. PsTaAH-130]|nr:hypothetical protein K376_03843 [Streptomyces sp. PsTaAH-130]